MLSFLTFYFLPRETKKLFIYVKSRTFFDLRSARYILYHIIFHVSREAMVQSQGKPREKSGQSSLNFLSNTPKYSAPILYNTLQQTDCIGALPLQLRCNPTVLTAMLQKHLSQTWQARQTYTGFCISLLRSASGKLPNRLLGSNP